MAYYFHRNGYVRHQNAKRLSREGYRGYKKGDEVRFCARSVDELAEIRRLLELAGFKAGRPFMKDRHYRQPVYGREAVRRLLDLIEAQKPAQSEGPARKSKWICSGSKRTPSAAGSHR